MNEGEFIYLRAAGTDWRYAGSIRESGGANPCFSAIDINRNTRNPQLACDISCEPLEAWNLH
jgi:hypothetical protein